MKQRIFDNVFEYTPEELVDHIKKGTFSFEELVSETIGELEREKKTSIQNLLQNGEDRDWQKACENNTIDCYREYLDIYQNGKYRDEARTKIGELEDLELLKGEEQAWEQACQENSKNAFILYNNKYPNGKYNTTANKKIEEFTKGELFDDSTELLISEIENVYTNKNKYNDHRIVLLNTIKSYFINQKISKHDFLNIIRKDNNLLEIEIIKTLLSEGFITSGDLLEIGIDKFFVRELLSYTASNSHSYPRSEVPEKREDGVTEVYFWGIPASGKTCALGAILSTAKNEARNMHMHQDSKAYGYMYELAESFITNNTTDVCVLPSGTPVGTIHEMKFTLTDNKDKQHPIICYDLAGELFTCIYVSQAEKDKLTQEQEVTLNKLKSLLAPGKNRNIHFFVIEYGAEKKMYNGRSQRLYLEAAATFIKEQNIFDKSTDGVYLLITKTDKIVGENNIVEHLTGYIKKHYKGFYNNLKDICKQYSINDGDVNIIPFTMGEVCFQSFCRFNPERAKKVVKVIMDRSVIKKKGNWFTDILKQ
ncbi:hypothetical protein EZS27_007265 [termite gut metagenome]|uniref:Uncharacterized protein n=1 Tax=termite gut metagenome TaxID=433724 RepID=A0A5J4SIJ6_9ZZZZ